MFDVTTFLIRWLFLSNLARDVAEIQTLPCQFDSNSHLHDNDQHQHHSHHPQSYPPAAQVDSINPQTQPLQFKDYPFSSTSTTTAATTTSSPMIMPRYRIEERWRDDCIRGILSYPPGRQRLLIMDAVRIELVQQLSRHLQLSNAVLKRHALLQDQALKDHIRATTAPSETAATRDDPFLEMDEEILRPFGQTAATIDSRHIETTESSSSVVQQATFVLTRQACNVLSATDNASSKDHSLSSNILPSDRPNRSPRITSQPRTDTNSDSNHSGSSSSSLPLSSHRQSRHHSRSPPSMIELKEARRNLREARDYLPQLVAAVLRSPSAFDSALSDPIQKLRQLLLRQCAIDPGFGIDLCWLLEAEVGRAWKTLFEHRQQTGRRLIVVLPAEKAAVMARIGNEKRGAFDLLQDTEQATAFGCMNFMSDDGDEDEEDESQLPTHLQSAKSPKMGRDEGMDDPDDFLLLGADPPRLPSSLSLRRCCHFGDSMHFIDHLSKVSSELRIKPPSQRQDFLHESLHEMNRRIRRRMVSRGDISLDVEDFRGPFDWPGVNDLTLDMLHSSVHFPLVPQIGVWPNGQPESLTTIPTSLPSVPNPEVVRVLNIVVPEARILASRERCPFLVHMEVADTHLEASDARLYASGVQNLGSTMEEALGMSAVAGSASTSLQRSSKPGTTTAAATATTADITTPTTTSYEIPKDFLRDQTRITGELVEHVPYPKRLSPRGGSQSDEISVEGEFHSGYINHNPYDSFRQHEYEALHVELHSQPLHGLQSSSTNPNSYRWTSVSTGSELLNKVYGTHWRVKCQEIRDASPFGHVHGWRLASFIMKAGEDIRREALVMQVITKLRTWFEEIPSENRPFMRPYTIMTVGGASGMIECLSDAKSIDEIKKRTDGFVSLREYFERAYGNVNDLSARHQTSLSFEKAQDNFLRSLVGYSLVCYILQIKDRHNANILLDRDGHIMHIDFGFVLGDTPKMGKVPIFSERAPFKLSSEFWEVLGGWNVNSGGLGVRFCKMFELAFACASTHADEIATLVEGIMEMLTSNARTARTISNGVRSRLRMRGKHGSTQQKTFIVDLVNAALTSWGTSTYDWLQRSMNGYQ